MLILVLVLSAATVATGLVVAVVLDVIVPAKVFAWEHAKQISIESREIHTCATVYAVIGYR